MIASEVPSDFTSRFGALGARVIRVRWIVRAPIWVYRAGLGAIFGDRLLMIEHVGRTSGRLRYVVLEVVDHPDTHSFVVASGFGTRAQWFKNIRANPNVRLWCGGRGPAPAAARPLTAGQARDAIVSYSRAHPRAWQSLRSVFEQTLDAPLDDEGTKLPLVWFDTEPTDDKPTVP